MTPTAKDFDNWKKMATAIRVLSMDAVEKAKSGHPGMPMGMADVATVLFSHFLKCDPQHPHWPDRDRFVLSAGHGSMLLYSLLYLLGYQDMTLEELKNFRQLGSRTAGHPEYGFAEGIETTTGPLGQGLANAVGMAIAEKWLSHRFGQELVNHKTFVIVGDGCLMEGISQEAISLAGHLQLNQLIVLFDNNGITIDGKTDLSTSENHLLRFQACGWTTFDINGHDFQEIFDALDAAQTSSQPVMISCRTVIGKGAPKKQGTAATHGAPLGPEEVEAARQQLNWSYPPFEIPEDILSLWRKSGEKGKGAYQAWQDRHGKSPQKHIFNSFLKASFSSGFHQAYNELIEQFLKERPDTATRQSSQLVLDKLAPHMPAFIGGSADLTGSNNTQAKSMKPITPTDWSGNYLHYGIREHGMAAAMNGLALHGGVVPYGGTFLTFSDYCRPAVRLSALMGIRVIYVMTHDSIFLGEDGPTHQPNEHLMSLRAIPNLLVFRPADAVEVAECWKLALESTGMPSILALTRQRLKTLRDQAASENLSGRGAYVLRASQKARRVTLLATGSEVGLAVEVQSALEKEGIPTVVVSMPCWELFEQQDPAYQQQVLGPNSLKVSIEAGSLLGWQKYVGEDGLVIGMETFGASAPYQQLYEHFGFTPQAILNKIKTHL